ncbi:MFS transporter [Halocatena halophila]|uniref:MFS transporter n=1 Tax=Halocatena halophila TaxID=2814576 RepID=UPI002ED3CEE9
MRALIRNKTFRRLFVGRLVTNAGDSLYYVAAMWLVYNLGGSAFYTGLAGFLTLAPQALQFLTGPFVDRWDIRRLLVGTQVLQGVLVLIIPVAAMSGWLSVTVVLVVMPVAAMMNQFVYPAQNAALPRIVHEEEIVDANSAFSFAYQGVDAAFSSLGGVLVALLGAVSLYLIDSVTFALTALIFAMTRIPDAESTTEQGDTDRVTSAFSDYVRKLREGIEYIRGTILVLTLGASMVVNFIIGAMMAVLPVFATLRGGSETYGILLAAITAGLLIGALGASPLKRVSLSRLMIIGFSLGGFAWLAAVYVQWLPATVALFCLAWIPVGVTNVVFMAMIQTYVPEELLGRVTSVSTSASAAAMPVGSLLGGITGDVVGGSVVVAVIGVGFLFMTLYWLTHPLLRYVPPVEEIDPAEYGLGQV